jgi:hypothetical protein
MGMMVMFSKFLYSALARTRPLTDPGLPMGLPRDGSGRVRVAGLYGADLPPQVFSNLYTQHISSSSSSSLSFIQNRHCYYCKGFQLKVCFSTDLDPICIHHSLLINFFYLDY